MLAGHGNFNVIQPNMQGHLDSENGVQISWKQNLIDMIVRFNSGAAVWCST
jgi:hypothetical protein